MAKNVDSDETAHYELSLQDLHCLHWYLVWSTGMKRLNVRRNKVIAKLFIYNGKRIVLYSYYM